METGIPGYVYNIDLETCMNSAQLLDWIMQVAHKSWCTPELLHGLIHFIDDNVGGIQSVFCSDGIDNEIKDWRCVFMYADEKREAEEAMKRSLENTDKKIKDE